MATKTRGLLTKFIYLTVLASLATAGFLGWNWLNGLVCRTVSVSGNVWAAAGEVVSVARVDTGSALFDIDPALIADRVRRHPWVKSADVTRLPPSTLMIEVEEREPAMLVIDGDGIPSTYLDAEGFSMPVTAGSSFDFPLITGVRIPTNPNKPVDSPAVRELLRSVSVISPKTDLLVSSFVVEPNGEIALRSVSVNGQGSITVRLGRRDFDEKLTRFQAFWQQAILTRPDRTYELIDLRFDSQIVTREKSSGPL